MQQQREEYFFPEQKLLKLAISYLKQAELDLNLDTAPTQ